MDLPYVARRVTYWISRIQTRQKNTSLVGYRVHERLLTTPNRTSNFERKKKLVTEIQNDGTGTKSKCRTTHTHNVLSFFRFDVVLIEVSSLEVIFLNSNYSVLRVVTQDYFVLFGRSEFHGTSEKGHS